MATKLGTIIADFSTALSTDIAIGGTTATLSSATDDDGVALPSGRYFFTLDGSNSDKEHISADLSGTALTNIKSVSRQGVETAGVVRKHRVGASVSITNFAHIKFINDLISGTTTLNASAPLGYDDAPVSITGNQLATATYVLGVVNGGAVTFDQQTLSAQTSGEALAINDLVYFKQSDQRWYKVDADDTTTFDQLQMGINKSTASGAGETIQVAISGPVSGFTGLTAGSKYYASNTAGAITTTAGTHSVFVGWALSTTQLLFDSVAKTLPTQKEKDALAGSTGIPSSSNKFITQDNTSYASVDQSQATQDASTAFGEADTTGLRNLIAQSFIPTKTKISGFNLYKVADTGTFTGTVTVTLEADSSGSPSGTALATKVFTNLEWGGLPVGEFEGLFATEYSGITVGDTYWIVATPSTSDTSNHPNLGTNSAGGYANGSVKYKNSTDSWVAVATIDLYFKTIEGVVSQVVKTDSSGKIDRKFFSTSELPIPAFPQLIPIDGPVASSEFAFGSNQDGSVFYIRVQGDGTLYRAERDSLTGTYRVTHSITPTLTIPSGDSGALAVLGDYVYMFANDGANIVVSRFLGADLTGEQVMTVPTVACTTKVTAWSDGKYLYTVSASSATTSRKWSVSGTVISAVSTTSVTGGIFAQDESYSAMFDGTTAYYVRGDATGPTDVQVKKLTDINGAAFDSTTSYVQNGMSDNSVNGIVINIDNDRMYLGTVYDVYDESAQVSSHIYLIPQTKP